MTDIKENTSGQGESMDRELKFKILNDFGIEVIEWIGEDGRWYHKRLTKDKVHIGSYPYSCKRLQYTGQKDKNGVEIYEGDIVSSNLGLLKGDVYYRPEGLYEIRRAGGLFEYDMGRFEVIGNIYQNKDLLSEK